MEKYINIFIDEDYPIDLKKYEKTKTLQRLLSVTQFCASDYTNLYSPLFLYTRFFHSLVVAHMTWHFSHNKNQTIKALLHDSGTPCFAHCIDYVLEDYVNQESSEKRLSDIVQMDEELLAYLKEDNLSLEELDHLSNAPILENKSPQLCTDRLDGVLHTCYIWLHTNTLDQIKEVYANLTVLKNEYDQPEIGFKDLELAEKFVSMIYIYAKELQSNKGKYIPKYVAEVVKKAIQRNFITIEDLYTKPEIEIVETFSKYISSWKEFNNATKLINTNQTPPSDQFYISSFETKKRNVIPLVETKDGNKRIKDISEFAQNIYWKLENYQDTQYAYVKKIKKDI